MAANITLFGLSSITTKGVSLVCLWLLNWVQCCSSDARSKLCTQMKLVCVQMREGEREREREWEREKEREQDRGRGRESL